MSIIFTKQAAYSVVLSSILLALSIHGEVSAKLVKKKTSAAAKVRKVAANPDELGEFANFSQWKAVAEFIDQMVEKHGFDRTELEATFRRIRYLDTTIQLIKPAPPGRPKNWRAYRARFIEPVRIDAGVAFWD